MKRIASAVTVAALALTGCAGAPGNVAGATDRIDAGGTPPVELDATAVDAGPCSPTWAALYAQYFGTKGVASCAGNGTCHGSTTTQAYAASFFLCPPGDQTGCYSGMTSAAAALLPPTTPFEMTKLYATLRKDLEGGISGLMPANPPSTFAFSESDLSCISRWVAAGAKND